MITTIFVLLFVYQIKHFLADYPLQNAYMLGKFKDAGWVKPLSAHCGVHAAFTYFIAYLFLLGHPFVFTISLGLATLDFVIHFTMDRIKASSSMLGRFKAMSAGEFMQEAKVLREVADSRANPDKYDPNFTDLSNEYEARALVKIKDNTYFWWCLGLDQMVHHLTHYGIIYILILIGN